MLYIGLDPADEAAHKFRKGILTVKIRRMTLSRPVVALTIAIVLMLVSGVTAQPGDRTPRRAADTTRTSPESKPHPQLFFAHLGVGVGVAVFSSGDIESFLRDELGKPWEITNVGADFAYFGRFGYKNIAQFEYRFEKGIGQKVFYEENDNIAETPDRVEVEMNVDSDEWLLKFNPFFPWIEDPSIGTYFVYGQGTAEYLDDFGEGFTGGDKSIFGFEVTKIARYYTFSASLERHGIEFDEVKLQDVTDPGGTFKAGWWLIQAGITLGVGY